MRQTVPAEQIRVPIVDGPIGSLPEAEREAATRQIQEIADEAARGCGIMTNLDRSKVARPPINLAA